MSLSVGDLVGYLRLDDDQYQRTLRKADGDASSFASRMGRGLTIAGAAFGALGVAGGSMGIKTAAGMEQAKIAFTTMLGSAEKADTFLKDLAAFAAKTPFEFPELQTAASSLISAGIEADKVIPIMTTLGDVTSGMGTGSEGVQRATVALQQMSAAGRITGEDLNQLRDAGIPVFDLLAAATGKSKEAVAALAQEGKLGAKELGQLMKALESGKGLERFSGLMEKQSQSLSGMWSTFMDTLNMGLASAITPIIPMLKDGLGGAAEFLANVLPKVASALQDIVAGTIAAVQWGKQHSTLITVVAGVIAAALIPNYILLTIAATKSAIAQVRAWVMTQAAAIKTVAVFIATRVAIVAGWVLMGVQAMAQAARMAAAWLIAMGPIGWVIAAVIGVAAVIWKNWDKIKSWTSKVWSWVVDFLKKALAKMVAFIMKWTLLGQIIKHWDKIKSGVSNAISALVGYVKAIPGRWRSALSNLGAVVRAVFGAAMERARDTVANIGSRIVDWIRGIPGRLMDLAGRFGDAGRALIQRFVDGMKNAAGIISGIAGNVWNAVKGMLNGAIGRINAALEFRINLPGPKDLYVNPPNIPALATGGRATAATLAVIGEGREPETVLPDSVLRGLLDRAHAAGRASREDRGYRGAPLIGQVIQAPGESAENLSERLWFKTRTRG